MPSHQAAIDGSERASPSLGCQRQPGSAAAKCAACWPVPLAISSATPCGGSRRSNSAPIGARLRSAAGLWRRGSVFIAGGFS